MDVRMENTNKIKLQDSFTRTDVERLLRRATNYYNVTQSWTIKSIRWGEEKHLGIWWSGARLVEDSYDTTDDWWFLTEEGDWISGDQIEEKGIEIDSVESQNPDT
jgi:hypothetical protein